jgi:chitinase
MKHLIKTAWIFIAALVCTAASFASVSVSISPTTVQVQPGGQTQFNAVVTGNPSSVVVWSLTGTNCGGNACGQITGQGLYTAPAVAPNPNVVTVTATSLADLSASASAAAIIGTSSDITVNV